MATKENPDAIEVDVSEVNTSDNSNTEMTETDKAQEEVTLATYRRSQPLRRQRHEEASGDTNPILQELKMQQTGRSPSRLTCLARQPSRTWNVA